jgi:hypothetical protein
MRSTGRSLLALAAFLVFAAAALAQRVDDVNNRHTQLFPDRGHAPGEVNEAGHGGHGGQNISYHGGPVIHTVKVVAIFWGAEWQGSGASTASHITGFFNGFGTTGEYNVITQYSDGSGHINPGSINTATWYDTSAPPTNATDSAVQGEVRKYINTFQGGVGDSSMVYEVFLPSTSYASFGTSDSCGGPNLVFCAYHSNFSFNGVDVKYSSMPYPSCGGCQWTGFSVGQNFDHFSCHETREAVTDPDGTAWYDRRGNEADDKCAWSPAPFLDAGFGYQYEWSNSAGGCVQRQ